MLIYIGSEDDVTRLIAQRLVSFCCTSEMKDKILFENISSRSGGTKALGYISKMIALGETSPVIGVYDADNNCVIDLLNKYAPNGWKSECSAVNFAIDEAEIWLLADRSNIARHFTVPISCIPDVNPKTRELSIPYKSSIFFLRDILSHSARGKYREHSEFCISHKNQKPSTYNTLWFDFILKKWNIERARKNSDSLDRAISRITKALYQ